ncbi:hypothetical protein Tco_0812926 [Tanacetum coccineum]
MSQAKAVSREKEKGVEFKDIKEIERPRPTSTRSLLTLKPLPKIDPKDKGKKKIEEEDESESESDGIPEAEKKFKQLASDEEMARKVQEEWEDEEERNRLAEEEATNDALIRNYDDIKARIEADRLLAEKLQEEEREQFTIEERAKFLHDTIHVGNFKHSDLKTKKFEEIQALYEKIKRSDEDFISIGSAKDERLIKKMNEKGIDSSKNKMVKEEDKEEECSKKRKGGHIKMITRKKARKRTNKTSDDEHKKCLKIVTFKTNGNFRAFNYLMEVLHIFDRQDLFHLYDLIRDQFSEVTLDGFELILWGDLKIMMEILYKGNDTVISGVRYPLSKDLLQRMLDLGLEVERESSVALDLIRLVSAGCTMILLVVIFPAGRLVSAGCTMILLVVIFPAGRLVSAGCTMVLLVVIFPAGRLVSAGCTMVLLVVIFPAGRLVSAGCTMVLLVVIFPAGRLVSAGCTMVLLEVIVPAGSYGLCYW